ncbi:MAG TPA: nicotinate phosphoribosyltransferase [Candidatus Dormibacteraeota bacterium]|nr:nicotinate phosphoribosyltransferase [Candidatus Dormibacteraeota bacterium]
MLVPNLPAAELLDYYRGPAADVYFQHAADTLAGAGLDPVVTMEFFCDRAGVLCGMRDVLAVLQEALGGEGEVWALDEGAQMEAREVVLRVRSRYSLVGCLETALLGLLASSSGWATAAREVVEAAAGTPVISFGARHVHPLVGPIMEYAAVVGGCAGCATPLGARLAGLPRPSGTMPHAMILLFGDTVKAALAFDQRMPGDVPRIVLVDTFKDEAEEALRVARELGDRLRGVRLDTPMERGRVTVELVKEVRARLDQAGHRQVGIFVSGGLDAPRIRQFVAAGAPVNSFGVGMAIASAPPIGFTADVKEVAGEPRAKRGRIPGLTPNPRLHRML